MTGASAPGRMIAGILASADARSQPQSPVPPKAAWRRQSLPTAAMLQKLRSECDSYCPSKVRPMNRTSQGRRGDYGPVSPPAVIVRLPMSQTRLPGACKAKCSPRNDSLRVIEWAALSCAPQQSQVNAAHSATSCGASLRYPVRSATYRDRPFAAGPDRSARRFTVFCVGRADRLPDISGRAAEKRRSSSGPGSPRSLHWTRK